MINTQEIIDSTKDFDFLFFILIIHIELIYNTFSNNSFDLQ